MGRCNELELDYLACLFSFLNASHNLCLHNSIFKRFITFIDDSWQQFAHTAYCNSVNKTSQPLHWSFLRAQNYSAYNLLCPKTYLCDPLKTANSKLETSELHISRTIKIRCQSISMIEMCWCHTRHRNHAKQNGKMSLFMRDCASNKKQKNIVVPSWRKQRLYISAAVQN